MQAPGEHSAGGQARRAAWGRPWASSSAGGAGGGAGGTRPGMGLDRAGTGRRRTARGGAGDSMSGVRPAASPEARYAWALQQARKEDDGKNRKEREINEK
jgi:hypothetical protein